MIILTTKMLCDASRMAGRGDKADLQDSLRLGQGYHFKAIEVRSNTTNNTQRAVVGASSVPGRVDKKKKTRQ